MSVGFGFCPAMIVKKMTDKMNYKIFIWFCKHISNIRIKRILERLNPELYYRAIGVKIGKNCRIYRSSFGTEPYLISLGNHVHIGERVRFITHDGGAWVVRELTGCSDWDYFGTIQIDDNVFIGNDVILLPNVHIGKNCVIGAGAIVTKNIPAGSIVAGVPARRIRSVEEYCRKIEAAGFHTKKMKAKEKEDFLRKYFKRNFFLK